MEPSLQWLAGALDQLHSLAGASFEQQRASDAALLQFQRSDAAWGMCLHLLTDHSYSAGDNPKPANLLWFAAQTLRTKVNEQGSNLSPVHLEQLKQCLLQQLMRPDLPTPLLKQLCLTLASTAALLPSWEAWLQPVGSSLPWRNAVQLLHEVAEEGISDWRHVLLSGGLCVCGSAAVILQAGGSTGAALSTSLMHTTLAVTAEGSAQSHGRNRGNIAARP